ncbi:kinase-like domain-containing protein [Collybia nuda]|uniref:Kinase-like domain-containing protein n=1 Tax=Collybia nuda TaxID=64659 RepID=A0A9P5Y3P2_9AGAR|nr:kinase-like domain-containing protein [Collybia nuda]
MTNGFVDGRSDSLGNDDLFTRTPIAYCSQLGHTQFQVNDLTNCICETSKYAVACGGFSDLYAGVLIQSPTNEADSCDPNAKPRRKVALKVLRAITNGQIDILRAKKRLNREVGVLQRLNHPNVTRFLGVSFHLGGRPSIVMEWYDRGDASTYLKCRPIEDRMSLIPGIIKGLRYLHTQSPAIVHGDLKGSNVLVNSQNQAVLADFGISKVLEELSGPTGNTTVGSEAGSFRWLAPERLDTRLTTDKDPTPASDIWAFGCTIYEILTGRIPYQSEIHIWPIMTQILTGVHPFSERDTDDQRLERIYTALEPCWAFRAECRPSIIQLERSLTFCFQ